MDLLELMMELDLTLFGSEKYHAIYSKIKYPAILKIGITYIFSHYFAKIKVDSFDSLSIVNRLILHNLIMHIKSVLNEHIKITTTIRYF